ncbi:hypothetical protein [Blastococcus sp. SYSU D00813]
MTAVYDAPAVDERTLTERTRDAILSRVFCGGIDGPLDAAVRVLADPELRDALDLRDQLRARHHLVVRDTGPGWREVCSCGARWDACDDAALAWGHRPEERR